jgi:hypothetical protein
MKIKNTLCILAVSTIMMACGGNQQKDATESNSETEGTENASEMDLNTMAEVDLSDFDLNASIYIPDDSKGKPEINTTNFGSIQIVVGKDYGIEIVPFGLTVSEKKEELEGDLVYDIEYLSESDNSIYFKRTIKDSDVKAEFHFFMTKEINGDLIEIKSLNQTYSERAIEKMIQSAKSLEEKPTA